MIATWRLKPLSERFSQEHNTITDNIIWLVKKYPSAAGDYRKLIQYYWYYVNGLKVFIPLNILEGLTQPESIGRAFRKLVADGFIVVDDKTRKARLQEEENFRSYYRRHQK